ncbi:hypothetical protein [Rhodococcus triatomae]
MAWSAIIGAFLAYDTRPGRYSDAELAAARELVESKFSTEGWNRRVP